MRTRHYDEKLMDQIENDITHAHEVPREALQQFTKILHTKSEFRKIATTINGTDGDLTIYYENDAVALWGKSDLPELYDEIDSPVKKPVFAHSLSLMTHLPTENVQDDEYNFETVIVGTICSNYLNRNIFLFYMILVSMNQLTF